MALTDKKSRIASDGTSVMKKPNRVMATRMQMNKSSFSKKKFNLIELYTKYFVKINFLKKIMIYSR